MKKSDILIILIWSLLILDCLSQGLSITSSSMATSLAWGNQKYIIWLFPYAFFVPAVFFQRKTALKFKFLVSTIDRIFGQGMLENFIFRLRPTILFMVAITTIGVSGVITTFLSNGPEGAYIISGFFISGGLGIFTAYLFSLKFPPAVR